MKGAYMSTLIKCEDLCKKYGNKEALKNINLEIEGGHIYGLLGPNGSGKTTFIKLLNGLLTPTSGQITINDMKIGPQTKAIVAYLPDHTYLDMNMKVKDVIRYFQDFYVDFDSDKATEMLEKLDIDPNDRIKTMSKGTKEKINLILVMSRKAMIYVLDEPIAGVDPAAREYILNLILTNYNPEAAVIISTHLIADVENILDQTIFIKKGEVIKTASVDEIREENHSSVDAYFREVFKC